jgi:hypothetical protein
MDFVLLPTESVCDLRYQFGEHSRSEPGSINSANVSPRPLVDFRLLS